MTRRHVISFSLLCWLTAAACLAAACDGDSQTAPSPTLSVGSVAISPPNVGLVDITAFTFTAEGFSSSDGGPLTYVWDFGDNTKATGGPSVSHTYSSTGQFDVWVTATHGSGVTAQARTSKLQVVSLSNGWALQNASGLTIFYWTSLTQAGTSVWGDVTFKDCRYTVTGTIRPPASLTLVYEHLPGDLRAPTDCAALPAHIPWATSFSGTADASFNVFSGTMTPGGSGTLTRLGGRGF